MHKHTITFTDYNGTERTKDLYFNLTEAEIIKMQAASTHGIQKEMADAIDSKDTQKLLDFFEFLVHKAYGIKSEDGLEFDKSPEITRRFENSAFYSPLYMSFFENEGAVGVAFITAVMPADLVQRAEAAMTGDSDIEKAAARSRAALQDHLPKQEAPKAPVSEQYVPQNQPSIFEQDHGVVETTNIQAPAPAMTEAEWAAQNPSNISRPLHESGPGYER